MPSGANDFAEGAYIFGETRKTHGCGSLFFILADVALPEP
jgi:hypothetical protein